MLYATMGEASHLLKVYDLQELVTDAERACGMLLEEFPGLRIVVLYVPQGRVARYRNDADRRASDGSFSGSEVSLLLPTRRADYQKLQSLSGEKPELIGNIVGAGDAFFGGFAAGWCCGLGVERSLVWAYGAGQLCGLLPTAQLNVGRQELRNVLRLELLDDQRLIEALFPEPSAAPPPLPPPLLPPTFFGQNEMHLIALRGFPSRLPMLMGQADVSPLGSAPTSKLTLQHVSVMLLEADALGYTPLQRANELLEISKRDSVERFLRRRVIDWFLSARILLSACSGHLNAVALNPLLMPGSCLPSPSANAREASRVGVQQATATSRWRRLAQHWFGGDSWRELAVLPEDEPSIIRIRLKIIDQIDVSRCDSALQYLPRPAMP